MKVLKLNRKVVNFTLFSTISSSPSSIYGHNNEEDIGHLVTFSEVLVGRSERREEEESDDVNKNTGE